MWGREGEGNRRKRRGRGNFSEEVGSRLVLILTVQSIGLQPFAENSCQHLGEAKKIDFWMPDHHWRSLGWFIKNCCISLDIVAHMAKIDIFKSLWLTNYFSAIWTFGVIWNFQVPLSADCSFYVISMTRFAFKSYFWSRTVPNLWIKNLEIHQNVKPERQLRIFWGHWSFWIELNSSPIQI